MGGCGFLGLVAFGLAWLDEDLRGWVRDYWYFAVVSKMEDDRIWGRAVFLVRDSGWLWGVAGPVGGWQSGLGSVICLTCFFSYLS